MKSHSWDNNDCALCRKTACMEQESDRYRRSHKGQAEVEKL